MMQLLVAPTFLLQNGSILQEPPRSSRDSHYRPAIFQA